MGAPEIGGVTKRATAGIVGIVPLDTRHEVRAITDGEAIVVDYPLREWAEGRDSQRDASAVHGRFVDSP